MRQCFTGMAALGLALAMAGAARADMPFDGFYIGGLGAYDDYSAKLEVNDVELASDGMSGVARSVMAGGGFELDDWYLGVEGEYGFNGPSTREPVDLGGGGLSEVTVAIKHSWSAAARYGYVFGQGRSLLAYGKLGWARAKAEASVAGPVSNLTLEGSLDGFTFGGGLEWSVSNRIALRAEYLRTNYEKAFQETLDTGRNSLRAGLMFRF